MSKNDWKQHAKPGAGKSFIPTEEKKDNNKKEATEKKSVNSTNNYTETSTVISTEIKDAQQQTASAITPETNSDPMQQLVQEIVETHTKKKRASFYETRTQVNVWLENELSDKVNRLAKGKGRGAKTKIFNQAIRLYFQVLESNQKKS